MYEIDPSQFGAASRVVAVGKNPQHLHGRTQLEQGCGCGRTPTLVTHARTETPGERDHARTMTTTGDLQQCQQ